MRVLNPICSAILLAMACTHVQAMSITQAIQSTLDNHPEIHADVNNRLSADEDVNIAKGGYKPTLDLVAGYGREGTDSPTTRALGSNHYETLTYTQSELRLRQMLFDGFNTPNEVARTKNVVNSRAYFVQGTSETLALRTIEVYLDVLKRRELLTLAKNNLQAHLRINDQIGLRSSRGVGSNADLDQSKARRALAEDNFYTAQVDLADAESSFFSAVGRMPDELETPSSIKGEVPTNLGDARQSMLDNNPYLKSAQADVASAESQYEVAKSPFYPRFVAELATGANNNLQGEEGHDNEWRAAVIMNYNLYNGSRDKARLQ
ncbi:MAG: bepC 1, partial [Pseudomonas sp.]|nr:bepC 1 [Pseudomonas sp.]